MGMETTDLVADLNRLYEDGSGDANLGNCTALLSHSLVRHAAAQGVAAVEAARVLLEMVAERATAPTQKAVLAAAAITGIAPRDWRGRGRRDSPNNLDRAEAAAKVANVMPDTARKRREDTYNPAYAEAIVAFERDTRRDSDLLTEFLSRCGATGEAIARLSEPEPAPDALAGSTNNAAHEEAPPVSTVHDLAPKVEAEGATDAEDEHETDSESESVEHAQMYPYRTPWRRLVSALLSLLSHPLSGLVLMWLLSILVSSYAPAATWPPLKIADAVLPGLSTLCATTWFMVGMDMLPPWPRPLPEWVQSIIVIVFITGAILAPITVWLAHFASYENDIKYAEGVAVSAQSGDNVYGNHEFDHDGSCPSQEQPSINQELPFAACSMTGGSVRATLTSNIYTHIGVYPTPNVTFLTATRNSPSVPVYYIETRFRTIDGTPLSACGISIEAVNMRTSTDRPIGFVDRSLLFHLHQQSAKAYTGEILSPFVGRGIDHSGVASPQMYIPGNDTLRFVGSTSLPGWEYGTWTKLGVLLDGDEVVFLVDDRRVIDASYPGMKQVNRASLAVLAGSFTTGGTATCEFDYLRVRRLPS